VLKLAPVLSFPPIFGNVYGNATNIVLLWEDLYYTISALLPPVSPIREDILLRIRYDSQSVNVRRLTFSIYCFDQCLDLPTTTRSDNQYLGKHTICSLHRRHHRHHHDLFLLMTP
jgi:hypothetical protein